MYDIMMVLDYYKCCKICVRIIEREEKKTSVQAEEVKKAPWRRKTIYQGLSSSDQTIIFNYQPLASQDFSTSLIKEAFEEYMTCYVGEKVLEIMFSLFDMGFASANMSP